MGALYGLTPSAASTQCPPRAPAQRRDRGRPEPAQIGHARSVDEDHRARPRPGERRRERRGLERQRPPAAPELQRDGERVPRRREVVAHHPVQRGDHRLAFQRREALAVLARERRQRGIEPGSR